MNEAKKEYIKFEKSMGVLSKMAKRKASRKEVAKFLNTIEKDKRKWRLYENYYGKMWDLYNKKY